MAGKGWGTLPRLQPAKNISASVGLLLGLCLGWAWVWHKLAAQEDGACFGEGWVPLRIFLKANLLTQNFQKAEKEMH